MNPFGALAQRYRRRRLQTRFALHVVLLVAVLFALLIPAVLLIQESVILGTARDNGLRLVAIFAFSSVQAVLAEDFLGLRQVVNSLGREKEVRYAMILDADGRVLIHSRVNQTGAKYDDPLTRRALTVMTPIFQETRSRRGEVLFDFAAPVLVLNQPRAVARIGISIADELALIQAAVGASRVDVIAGADATPPRILTLASRYDVFHFAVHAIADDRDPLASHLRLAPEAQRDGFLNLTDIARARWHAPLVVLSACETLEGPVYRGEGMMGLARAFLETGAGTVVATEWPVGSASADLMGEFYRRLTSGASPAAALRAERAK